MGLRLCAFEMPGKRLSSEKSVIITEANQRVTFSRCADTGEEVYGASIRKPICFQDRTE